jgi:hypothetical protein
MVSATRVPNKQATWWKAIGTDGVPRVVDRLITPSAHYLASSGIGSARLQLNCSPCLADLWTASATVVSTDISIWFSPVIIVFQAMRFMLFPDGSGRVVRPT